MSEVEVLQGLTASEQIELHQLEERITGAFYEIGQALSGIRDKRLYRANYKTFEDYCNDRWNFTRQRVNQLISASQVVENLTTNGCQNLGTNGSHLPPPTSERQVRTLVGLEPELQVKAYEEAAKTAPNGKMTAAHVAQTVDRITHPASQRNIGDSEELPPLDELFALYAQIAEKVEHQPTQKYRNQFMVERSAYPSFTLKFLGRGEAWKY